MEENESIGKLIKTLKNIFCPDCNAKLQLRSREDIHLIDGENVVKKNQYHYCKCGYFEKIKDEKFNRARDWKPVELPPEPDKTYKKEWKKDGSSINVNINDKRVSKVDKSRDNSKFNKRG